MTGRCRRARAPLDQRGAARVQRGGGDRRDRPAHRAALTELGIADFEILVVDDGSSDATAARASSCAGLGPARPRGVASAQPRATARRCAPGLTPPRATRSSSWTATVSSIRPRSRGCSRSTGPTASSAGIASGATTRGRGASTTRRSSVSCDSYSGRRCAMSTAPSSCFRARSAGVCTPTERSCRTELLVRARRSGYRLMDVGVHHYPRTTGRATGADVRVVAARVPRALAAAHPPGAARRARSARVSRRRGNVVVGQRAGGGRGVAAALARRLRRRARHRLPVDAAAHRAARSPGLVGRDQLPVDRRPRVPGAPRLPRRVPARVSRCWSARWRS